jgi:type IV pilus assembly protein PilB
MARMRIGEMLVDMGRLDSVQLQVALAHQRQWGGRLGHAIVQLGFLQEGTLLDALAAQLGVPFIELGAREIEPKVLALVPRKLVVARRVLPLELRTETRRGPLLVALADPADLGVIDEIAFVTGLAVKPALAAEADLDRAIERHYGVAARRPGAPGDGGRAEAIELPVDTSPLTTARRSGDDPAH